ncbi:hypothetical protein ACFQX4_23080 [Roseomonas sp. GCM10028921]
MDRGNPFIEGQKVSAVAKGMARSLEDARQKGVLDVAYRLDLYRLMTLFQQPASDTRGVVFGSITDSNGGRWRHAANVVYQTG